MVGREAELRALLDAFDDLERDRRRGIAAVVLGEPGIGKSRLLAEFATQAAQRNARVMRGRCPPVGVIALPYAALSLGLHHLAESEGWAWLRGRAGTGARHLASIAPLMAPRSRGESPRFDDAHARTRVVDAYAALVRGVARDRPLVVLVDDLQWVADATLEVLAFIAALAPARMMLVVAARAGELPDNVDRFAKQVTAYGEGVRLDLQGLDAEGVTEQLVGLTGTRPQSADAGAMLAWSGGNPFVVEVLTTGDPALGEHSVTDLLRARVGALPPDAQSVCRLLAIAGHAVATDVLGKATGLSGRRVGAALVHGRRANALVETGGRVSLRHDLLAEALQDALSAPEVRLRHARLAEAMISSSMGADDRIAAGGWHALIAMHTEAAGDPGAAVPYLAAAADRAVRAGALGEGRSHLERALAILDLVGQDSVPSINRDMLFERLADVAGYAGDLVGTDAALGLAIAAADPRDEERRLFLTARRAQWRWALGDEAGARPLRQQIAAVAARRGARIRSLALLGAGVRALTGEDRFAEAEPLARLAARRARRQARPDIESETLGCLGVILAFTDRVDAGIACLRQAADLAAASGHVDRLELVALNHVSVLWDAGRIDACGKALRHWNETARRLGLVHFERTIDVLWVRHLVWTGAWTDAQSRLDKLDLTMADDKTRLDAALAALELSVERADGECIANQLQTLRRLGALAVQPALVGGVRGLEARAQDARGDAAAGVATVFDGLDRIGDAVDTGAYESLVLEGMRIAADHATDEPVLARDWACALLVRLRTRHRGEVPRTLGSAAIEATLLSIRGELSRLRGRGDTVRWNRAACAWKALRHPRGASYAWLRAAETAAATGDRAIAARYAKLSHAEADTLEGSWIPAAALAIGQAATQVARSGVGDGVRLTAREREVLELVAVGSTNRQIAERLIITEKTVSIHVSNVLGKLGVARRTEAAIIAITNGLVPRGPSDGPGSARPS